MESNKIKYMVMVAVMTALVFVGSRIGIHTPSITGGGYVHLGTAFMFVTAFVMGKRAGAFAGGVGMGLFDFFSEYSSWAPFTFIISLLMGLAAGKIAFCRDGKLDYLKVTAAVVVCTVIKVLGYYITEAFFFADNFVAPLASVPGNVVQMVLGGVVGVLICQIILKRHILLPNH